MIFQTFFPEEQAESAYDIAYEDLFEQGYRGVIFDIDNTLVEHGADADERAEELFRRLGKTGWKSCLLSNNKEERVRRFNQKIHTQYIYKAGKPSRKGYQEAMKRMGTRPENTVFVGDQLFTDVWGAKRAGLKNILVKPIAPKEEIQIVLKRKLERIVLYFWKKEQKKGREGA